jgi:hypothetical protein
MTPEQQRIAIAEACGWKLTYPGCETSNWKSPVGQAGFLSPPNYLNDLNAMHEAEKILTGSQYDNFVCYLLPKEEQRHYNSWGLEGVSSISPRLLVSPTAAQRAEAFLRTLNLWTES